jgi:hypothetical protein
MRRLPTKYSTHYAVRGGPRANSHSNTLQSQPQDATRPGRNNLTRNRSVFVKGPGILVINNAYLKSTPVTNSVWCLPHCNNESSRDLSHTITHMSLHGVPGTVTQPRDTTQDDKGYALANGRKHVLSVGRKLHSTNSHRMPRQRGKVPHGPSDVLVTNVHITFTEGGASQEAQPRTQNLMIRSKPAVATTLELYLFQSSDSTSVGCAGIVRATVPPSQGQDRRRTQYISNHGTHRVGRQTRTCTVQELKGTIA